MCKHEAKGGKKNIRGWIHRDTVSVYPKGSTDDILGIKMQRLLFSLNRTVPVAIVSTSFRQKKYIKVGSWLKQLPTSRDRVILRKSRTLLQWRYCKNKGVAYVCSSPCTDLTMMEHAKQNPFFQKRKDREFVLAMAWISAFQNKPHERSEEILLLLFILC